MKESIWAEYDSVYRREVQLYNALIVMRRDHPQAIKKKRLAEEAWHASVTDLHDMRDVMGHRLGYNPKMVHRLYIRDTVKPDKKRQRRR